MAAPPQDRKYAFAQNRAANAIMWGGITTCCMTR